MATRHTIAPQLADITQDIAGEIPISLILGWTTGNKSQTRHKKILSDYTTQATVVSSDSAGLSKLSRGKTLLEVMKLVSDPKEIIFQYGSAIGGMPIGIWAADNTQMLYPSDIEISDVVNQMCAAQKILTPLTVKVGLCIHHGEYIHIGGGLFGKDADIVETIAESYTEGGEILLTAHTQKHIQSAACTWDKREISELKQTAYKLITNDQIPDRKLSKAGAYPYPFSDEFYTLLTRMSELHANEINTMYSRFSKDKVVILVKVRHSKRRFLLDQFAHWILANAILQKEAASNGVERIKSNGSLGIFVTDHPVQAIEFARDVKERLTDQGYESSIGIARGEVLLFPLKEGKDIAGNPVNVASKLAEDVDTDGNIWIESSVQIPEKHFKSSSFAVTVSNVELTGVRI